MFTFLLISIAESIKLENYSYFLDVKKLLSFFLLLILTFNWVGFDLIVALQNYSINQTTQLAIDAGLYDRNSLIDIRVEMNLPYTSDWTAFEKISGSLTQEGVVYNFVERKYEKGAMLFRFLPNNQGTILTHAKNQYYAEAHDFDQPEKNNQHTTKNVSVKKLNIETPVPGLDQINWAQSLTTSLSNPKASIAAKDGFGFKLTQPPEA
jgi:hypothetical protein